MKQICFKEGDVSIPITYVISTLMRVDPAAAQYLEITCKDFRRILFEFQSEEDLRSVHGIINKMRNEIPAVVLGNFQYKLEDELTRQGNQNSSKCNFQGYQNSMNLLKVILHQNLQRRVIVPNFLTNDVLCCPPLCKLTIL